MHKNVTDTLKAYQEILAARPDGAALVVGAYICAVWDGAQVYGMQHENGAVQPGTEFDFRLSEWDPEKGCWLGQDPTKDFLSSPAFVRRKMSFVDWLAAVKARLECGLPGSAIALPRGSFAVLVDGKVAGMQEGESPVLFKFSSVDWDEEHGHWRNETLEDTVGALRSPNLSHIVASLSTATALTYQGCLAGYRALLVPLGATTALAIGRGRCVVLRESELMVGRRAVAPFEPTLRPISELEWDADSGSWHAESAETTARFLARPIYVEVAQAPAAKPPEPAPAESPWGKARYADILQQAKERYGKGWEHMSSDQRENFIAARILQLLLSQDGPQFSCAHELADKVFKAREAHEKAFNAA